MKSFKFRRNPSNKMNAQKVIIDGIEFASKKEGNRYCELRILERAGKIKNLQLQKKYELIPSVYEECNEKYIKGSHKGEHKRGKLIERGIDYIADFVYEEGGKYVVEDVKGYRATNSASYKVFVMKRKMMLHFYGIKIVEV